MQSRQHGVGIWYTWDNKEKVHLVHGSMVVRVCADVQLPRYH